MLNQLAKEIHEANVKKGFYDEKREFGTLLMLVTSELAEALEADRKGRNCEATIRSKSMFSVEDNDTFKTLFENYVKDTKEDEIADTMIRLFDLAGHLGMDLDFHVKNKLRYNSLRGRKHGKKY